MFRRIMLIAVVAIFFTTGTVFAGIEWQAKIVSSRKDKETTTLVHFYAQQGNVREEFVEVGGQGGLRKQGMYWLYKGKEDMVYVVNPEEKTYMAVSFDSLMKFTSALTQLMQMKISNVNVEVKELGQETVGEYKCKHLTINSSYDMEIKIMIMKVKSHIEQTKELWGTTSIPMDEMADAFKARTFRVGIKDLDDLIEKQIEIYKDLGFVVKSVTTEKNTTKNKTETSITTMTVSDITTKNLSQDLFEIPDDYKKVELKLKPTEGGGE